MSSLSIQVTTEYSQFLEYHKKYLSEVAAHNSMTKEQSCKSTALTTPAESYGMSCHDAASQAHHALEAEKNDPCTELDHYLSNPLELPGTDIIHFWMVSFVYSNFVLSLLIVGCTG